MILSKAYLGTTEVKKVYLGDTLVLNNSFDGTFEYNFDGNITETTGNHQGTLTGTLTYVAGQGSGQAARFTGSQYIDIPADADLGVTDFTVAFWMRDPAISGGYEAIIEGGRSTTSWKGVFKDGAVDNRLAFRWQNGGIAQTNRTSTAFISANTWYHVIMTIDGTTARIYVDGVLDTEQTGITLNAGSADSLRIGTNTSGSEGLTMDISNLQFWNTGKTPAEVATIYSNAQ